MNKNLMISYSRQQTPFVDRFYDDLQRSGYTLWLDYHSLVPAQPWYQQIEKGVLGADVVILVVSQSSIFSKNVEPEWRLALEHKKRIILAVFEATPLPPELSNFEWVDFRTNYRRGIKELKGLLNYPEQTVTPPVPQKGFRAPLTFWVALLISLFLVLGTIPLVWTIIVPYIIFPLPWNIYKRNYSLSRVLPILMCLPVLAIYAPAYSNTIFPFINNLFDVSYFLLFVPLGWLMLLLLISPAMQRRARPEAAFTRFANPLSTKGITPTSVSFFIDHASEDGKYAEDLRAVLEKHGHVYARPDLPAEAIFVLLSSYKKETKYDPDQQSVFPILLQAVTDIEVKLQRIQWIDFRKGIKNAKALARLLPEPQKLLKALASPPTGAQEIFPTAVSVLQYFYLFVGLLGGGSILLSILTLVSEIVSRTINLDIFFEIVFLTIQGILLAGTIVLSVRGLRFRRGGISSIYPLIVLLLFQASIYFSNFLSSVRYYSLSSDASISFLNISFSGIAFLGGLGISAVFIALGWKDLYRWFPRRQSEITNFIERTFLLYTPKDTKALFLHALFHIVLLFAFVAPWFGAPFGPIVMLSIFFVCLSVNGLILVPIYWFAKRYSR